MLVVIGTIMTITVSYICSANNYCENICKNMGSLCAVLTVIATIMTITGKSVCSVNS